VQFLNTSSSNGFPLVLSLGGCAEAATGFASVLRLAIATEVLTGDTAASQRKSPSHQQEEKMKSRTLMRVITMQH
jgi:hypothetical protein